LIRRRGPSRKRKGPAKKPERGPCRPVGFGRTPIISSRGRSLFRPRNDGHLCTNCLVGDNPSGLILEAQQKYRDSERKVLASAVPKESRMLEGRLGITTIVLTRARIATAQFGDRHQGQTRQQNNIRSEEKIPPQPQPGSPPKAKGRTNYAGETSESRNPPPKKPSSAKGVPIGLRTTNPGRTPMPRESSLRSSWLPDGHPDVPPVAGRTGGLEKGNARRRKSPELHNTKMIARSPPRPAVYRGPSCNLLREQPCKTGEARRQFANQPPTSRIPTRNNRGSRLTSSNDLGKVPPVRSIEMAPTFRFSRLGA